MWSDYFFYLMGLPENERNTQILILVCFWIVILLVGTIYEYLKNK